MELPELDPGTRIATLHLDLTELGYLAGCFLAHADKQDAIAELLRMKLNYLRTLAYAQSNNHPLRGQAQREAREQRKALEIFYGVYNSKEAAAI